MNIGPTLRLNVHVAPTAFIAAFAATTKERVTARLQELPVALVTTLVRVSAVLTAVPVTKNRISPVTARMASEVVIAIPMFALAVTPALIAVHVERTKRHVTARTERAAAHVTRTAVFARAALAVCASAWPKVARIGTRKRNRIALGIAIIIVRMIRTRESFVAFIIPM